MDLEQLKSLARFSDFDALPEYVFIDDATTLETIYTNKAYKTLLEMGGNLPNFDNRFLSLRAFPATIEGRRCVVQVSEAIQPYRQRVNSHEVRLAISDIENILRTEMQSDFLYESKGRSYHESLIDRIVRRAMTFYHCPKAHVVAFDPKYEDEAVLYQYDSSEESDPLSSKLKLSALVRSYHNAFFRRGYSLLSEDLRDFECMGDGLSQKLESMGIRRLINIPYFIEGRLSGLLILANPGGKDDKIDFFFADFATNAVGTMAYRGRLYSHMYMDDVTGFPWTSAIDTFYPGFVASHPDIPIAILEFDFLHFRMLSRTYGREVGERVLRKTAEILREKYPRSILSRRIGSDIFIVVTTGIAEAIAAECAKIIEEIKQAFPGVMLTIAFGIYQVKDPDEELDYSLLKASFAHRYAKEDPLNRIKIFDDAMDKAESMTVFFANHFHTSLENGDFIIYIQPKYNLQTETIFGGEALIRWKLGDIMVPPGDFIPQFEANGLTRQLDLYVLKKVCELLARWLKESPDTAVPLSVNFSRADFADPHLFESIIHIITDSGVPAPYVEIEITESAYVDYEKQIISFIQKCHAAGIKVLMDDFGSGVSSFNSLKNLDIDCIKLDYKFLSETGDNRKKRKIIEGIVALARAIRIPIIVEGVETKTEAAFFRALGVRYVQGYLFGKPMPVDQFEELSNLDKGLPFFTIEDPRMILNEILDANSNLNFFFDNIDTMAGIFRFDGTSLTPVLINRCLNQAITSIGVVSNFVQRDLLSYFEENQVPDIRNALASARRNYVFSEKKVFEFHYGDILLPMAIQGMLLQSEENGERFFLLTGEEANRDDKPLSPSQDVERTVEWLLSSTIQGCAIIDSDEKILAHNAFLTKYYPDIAVGADSRSLFRFAVDKAGILHRAYSTDEELVFEVSSRPIPYKGKNATLLVFSELGDPGSFITEIGGDGFKFYDRMVSNLSTIAVCYVEIDLEDDTFFQINFKDHDDFAYHDAVNHGSYTNDLYQRFLASVAPDELSRIQERMALQNLVEACKAMSPFTLSYKLGEEGRVYHRLRMRFHFDKGHHYACFFLEDTSEERMRDYDPLSGCYGRIAGMALMERHIIDNPLDKMAFFILDIDDFKTFNDTYGHPLGDRVLANVRAAFTRLPEDYIIPTRLGGDEFCLLYRNRGGDFDVDKARAEIEDCLRDIGFRAGLNKEIRTSVGCAFIPEDGGDIKSVYPKADSDLYAQKKIHKSEK